MADGNKASTILNAPLPRRALVILLISLTLLMVGFILGYWMHSRGSVKVIASQRTFLTHSRYSNALPARATVTLEQASTGCVAVVKIPIEYSRFSTGIRTITLGTSPSEEDAVARWAFVDWGNDGLRVGKGTSQVFISQKELEGGGR